MNVKRIPEIQDYFKMPAWSLDSVDSFRKSSGNIALLPVFSEDVGEGLWKKSPGLLKFLQDAGLHNVFQEALKCDRVGRDKGDSELIFSGTSALLVFCVGKRNLYAQKRKVDFCVAEHMACWAEGMRLVGRKRFSIASICLRQDMLEFADVQVVANAVANAIYKFEALKQVKSRGKAELKRVMFLKIVDSGRFNDVDDEKIKQCRIMAQSLFFMRDMINTPANICSPEVLSRNIVQFLNGSGIDVEVLDEVEMEKLGMQSMLSVSQGSCVESKFVIARYRPATLTTKKKIALVGKGVTFDTGGISLKPAQNMHEMKGDMSGAACVAGVMGALGRLGCPFEVVGVMPLTENMPSGKATRPGDVVRAMNGTSIEILNTDAEGRLILADALCWLAKEDVTHVVDVATLTGACVVALGSWTTGIMGNDLGWIKKFETYCQAMGERAWALPLFDVYGTELKSSVADVANIGCRYGGAITAAAFLKKFVPKNASWMHLDIAGTSWADNAESKAICLEGGVPVMIASLVEFLRSSTSLN